MLKQVQHDNEGVLIMKIVIVGGHLSPALAVIEELGKDTEVLFVGRKHTFEGDKALSLEYREIVKRKIRLATSNVAFAEISTGRWQRKFTRHTIPSLFKIPYGLVQSFFILNNFKPDVVLGFGGYLSIPVGIAAFVLRIPLVIHEQTLEAGAANKTLSFFAGKICISWESSRKFFPERKTVLTGNPIRKFQISKDLLSICHAEFISASRFRNKFGMTKEHINLPIIYVTGGSAGSHYINTLIEGCLEELLEKFVVIHQTGDAKEFGDFERLSGLKETLPAKLKARYYITKFVEPQEVGSILNKADLVISRSGINTVTELIYFEKPSLLIPLPYSQNNEQVKNALFFRDQGLGEVIYQSKDLTSKKLLEVLMKMFDNIDRYKILKRSMKQVQDMVQDDKKMAARQQARLAQRAARKIVEVVYNEARIKKE